MDLIVSAKTPYGPKDYIVDRGAPLGAGATAIVYRGVTETGSADAVAVKVARPGSDSQALESFFRELEIIRKLRHESEAGGQAVPWATRGEGTNAACIVMEMVAENTQLSRALSAQKDAKLPGTSILMKEVLATASGVGYAELLLRMAAEHIISRGDRKGTDFRWVSNPADTSMGRLVVLDWNRAVEINPEADNWSEVYRERLTTDLARGRLDDIRLFGKWWSEFLLEREVRGNLPDLNDPEENWQRLSLNLRRILRHSLEAGRLSGYRDDDNSTAAAKLLQDLQQHQTYLREKLADKLIGEMAELRTKSSPGPDDIAQMQILFDLASRYEYLQRPDNRALVPYRDWVENHTNETRSLVNEAVAEIRDHYLQADYGEAKEICSTKLAQLEGDTALAVTSQLRLLRWQTAIEEALRAPLTDFDTAKERNWAELMVGLQQQMDVLDQRNGGSNGLALKEASERWTKVVSREPGRADGLAPLRLELDIREALLQSVSDVALLEKWRELESQNKDYARTLRLSYPELDGWLNDKTGEISAEDHEGQLAQIHSNLFAMLAKDCKPANDLVVSLRDRYGAVSDEHRPETYLRELSQFYHLHELQEATQDDSINSLYQDVLWLDNLLTSTIRGRLAEALSGLEDPPAILSEDLVAVYQAYVHTVHHQTRALLDQQAPRWPGQLRESKKALEIISHLPYTTSEAERDNALLTEVTELYEQVLSVRETLGYQQGMDWASFLQQVTSTEADEISENLDGIDDALITALKQKLEVWEQPASAESLSSEDREAILEGYRASTLFALRTRRLLPARLDHFGQTLQEQANALAAQAGSLQALDEALIGAASYPAAMMPLITALRSLEERLDQLESAERSAKDVQTRVDRREMELGNTLRQLKLTQEEIETALAKTANASAQRQLALRYMSMAFDSAFQLDYAKTSKCFTQAKNYLNDQPAKIDLDALESLELLMDALSSIESVGASTELKTLRDIINNRDYALATQKFQNLRSRYSTLDWEKNPLLAALYAEYLALERNRSVSEAGALSSAPDRAALNANLKNWDALLNQLTRGGTSTPSDSLWSEFNKLTDELLDDDHLTAEQARELRKRLFDASSKSTDTPTTIKLTQLLNRVVKKSEARLAPMR